MMTADPLMNNFWRIYAVAWIAGLILVAYLVAELFGETMMHPP